MSKPAKVYDRKAVYTGRRIGRDGKIYHRFELLPKRDEMHFAGIKQVWIGYTYKCTENSISAKPERTEDTKENNPAWEGADEAVDAHNAKKRAEANMRKEAKKNVQKAVEALRPIMRGLSIFEREELVKYLVDKARSK